MDINEIRRKNLTRLIEKMGIKPVELAKRIGTTSQYINNLVNEEKGFSDKAASKLAEAFGVGVEEFYKGIFPEELFESKINISDDYKAVPLYESGKLSAGNNGIEFDKYEKHDSMVIVFKPELQGRLNHKLAAIRVGGESMEPTVIKNSIVLIDLSDNQYIESRMFAVNTPEAGLDMVSIKRVQKWEKGFVLLSDNQNFKPILTELDWNRLCVGRIVWMWRDISNL